jgi:hypothetical protein
MQQRYGCRVWSPRALLQLQLLVTGSFKESREAASGFTFGDLLLLLKLLLEQWRLGRKLLLLLSELLLPLLRADHDSRSNDYRAICWDRLCLIRTGTRSFRRCASDGGSCTSSLTLLPLHPFHSPAADGHGRCSS